jgi:hypothetical protein
MKNVGLSARAHDKVPRVARTIADFERQVDGHFGVDTLELLLAPIILALVLYGLHCGVGTRLARRRSVAKLTRDPPIKEY